MNDPKPYPAEHWTLERIALTVNPYAIVKTILVSKFFKRLHQRYVVKHLR